MKRTMLSASCALPQRIQDLSPRGARLCLGVRAFLRQDLAIANERLLVGFSGGADSTALLLILHLLAPTLNLTLSPVHLDHGLRPSSQREAAACKDFCLQLGLDCLLGKTEPSKMSAHSVGLEEWGREQRYAFYRKGLLQTSSAWIALGHQNDDLAEDILMRLVRGTGWPALGGMPAKDDARQVIRPLLLTPRALLEQFLEELGITWTQDESNQDLTFMRNRVRMKILPLLREENPAFLRSAAHLWQLARFDDDYFASLLPTPPPRAEGPAHASALETPDSLLQPLPKALRLRLYKSMLERLGPGRICLQGILALDRAWLERRVPTEHRFPGHKKAFLYKKGILWKIENQAEERQ